jgi:F-type H+-transporting ATPase subunit gamma
MTSSRQLKTKIKAVRNIKQITKAVQMVSATKMRRSQQTALNARPYAKKSMVLLLHLLKSASKEETENIFWNNKNNKKMALIVVTSDKGLAGSFNSSVLREAAKWKKEQEEAGKEVDIVAVGKKGRDFFKKRGANIAAEFLQFGDIITFGEIQPLGKWILNAYEQKQYDRFAICSNRFISALIQKVSVHQILPIGIEALEKTIQDIIPKTGKYSELASEEKEEVRELPYVLEPSREIIIETLIKNLVLVEIMYFVFESNASEHSARMIAMKNATENAGRLQEELTLELNKARQASITQELTEISTAKEALMAE